ncbi:hypothetical protein [Vannielia sp. SX4]|uniref:hypothetical protein n=1 Tax=Vannielia sp. SX4 TaxID=3463852 RepID=UPI004057F746
MSTGKRLSSGVAAAAMLVASCLPSHAQDEGGLLATATVGLGVLHDEDGTRARNELGFTLSSSTRRASLSFSLSGALEYPDAEDDLTLEDPTLALAYKLTGANASLAFDAAYRQVEISTLVFDEELDPTAPITDTGYRTTANLGAELTFGIEAPFGGTVGLGLREVAYHETDSPALFDYDTRNADLALRFTVDPRIELSLTGSYEDIESEGAGRDRTTTAAGLGAEFQINKSLTASLNLRHTEIETSAGGGPVTRQSGPEWDAALVRTLPDGALTFDLASTVTSLGRRHEANISGTREFPAARLAWSVGLSQASDGEVDGLFSLSWTRDGKRGSFQALAERDVRASTFGDEALVDRLSLGYRRNLTELSGLTTSLTYRRTDYLDPAADTVEQMEFGLGFTRSLTERADLTARFSHARSRSGTQDAMSENTIYLGVQRNFSWRP